MRLVIACDISCEGRARLSSFVTISLIRMNIAQSYGKREVRGEFACIACVNGELIRVQFSEAHPIGTPLSELTHSKVAKRCPYGLISFITELGISTDLHEGNAIHQARQPGSIAHSDSSLAIDEGELSWIPVLGIGIRCA